jgi:hypothetical protein
MWSFNSNKDVDKINFDEHAWSVLQTEDEEGPILIRVNNTAKKWAKHPRLNIKVGFAIPLQSPNPGGLPDPDENAKFNDIEDEICELLKATGPAIQVLAITTGTFKEYVFYIENGESIEQAHKQAMSAFSEYDIQCYGENDPKWQGYFQWQ